jgi:hypothetical protein
MVRAPRRWRNESERRRECDKRNRKKITAYQARRLRTNPVAALIDRLRKRLWKSLHCASKNAGHKLSKAGSILPMIGCAPNQLIEHLGKDLWAQRHKRQLAVDHIWPCSMYDFSKPEEQFKCFNYRNLQLITKHENSVKHNRPPSPSIGCLVPEEYRPGSSGSVPVVGPEQRVLLSKEQAEKQAVEEGLVLKTSRNSSTGYVGVYYAKRPNLSLKFYGEVVRNSKKHGLGYFKTAEHAALAVARFSRDCGIPNMGGKSRIGTKYRPKQRP